MTSLTNISSTIKQNSWLIILFFFVLISGTLIAIRFFSKPQVSQTKTPSAPLFETLPASNSGFIVTDLKTPSNVPSSLPIYNVNAQDDFLSDADTFAQKLGFTDPPQNLDDINLGPGLAFSKTDSILTVFKTSMSYQKSTEPTQNSNFNLPELETKAADYISKLGLTINTSSPQQITYSKFIGESHFESPNPENASLVNFYFGSTIESLKIIGDIFGVKIALDPLGNMAAFTLNKLELVSQKTQYQLIDFNQALNLLVTNQGSLIKISGEREDIETTKILSEINLSNSYIGYYLPSKSAQTVQPIWLFEGTTTVDDLPAKVTFAVPAIKNTSSQ